MDQIWAWPLIYPVYFMSPFDQDNLYFHMYPPISSLCSAHLLESLTLTLRFRALKFSFYARICRTVVQFNREIKRNRGQYLTEPSNSFRHQRDIKDLPVEVMESSKKRRGHILRNSISFVLVVVSFCSLLVLIFSTLRLPEISLEKSYHGMINRRVSRDEDLGKFAEMMIEMLPEDLAFTVFVPSEKAFERDLRLRANDSLIEDNVDNTYAIVSRILGFSAVPRTLFSVMIPFGKEISYDSLSGFTLYISKASDGMLVINRVKSERVDLKKGKIIVHLMDGVIMDADFEQSVQLDNIEED